MTSTLIGRDHAATLLRGQVRRAVDSHGGLVLITGEAGIGKTALVTAAAEEARRSGALVLSGSCWDSESAPGYWPWVQVVRGLRREASEQDWNRAQQAAGGGLAVLLGERPSDASDGFQLYDAVTTALVAASQSRPVVVFLEDLHWADPASLRLLEFAAQQCWFERLLLVGTYRDDEAEATGHPLRPLILPLVSRATTVTLAGLGADEVAALMARTSGAEIEPALVAEVHRRTGGNPFFVEQTARLWHSGGAAAVAPGVRDAVRRRLSLLPAPVARLLSTAAVLGREFHRQVLAAVAGSPVPVVDRLLAQAATVRLITVRGAGRFAFAHDLVRETLYDEFDDVGHRHAEVVRAIDRAPALAAHVMAADIAHHAYLAGDELGLGRVLELLSAAARDATGRLATEEATGHLRRALDHARYADPGRHVMAALDLGQHLHHLGESDAWPAFDEAAARVRAEDDPQLLARVALTLHDAASKEPDERPTRELLEQAHRALVGVGAPAAGPMPEDRLAAELASRLSALAHSGGDDEALVFSLWARYQNVWGLGSAAERVAVADEMTAVGRRIGDPELEHFGASLSWVTRLELGDPAYRDRYEAFRLQAERDGSPLGTFASDVDHSIICTLTGRFAHAEDLLARAVGAVEEDQFAHFGHKAAHLRWAMTLLQGRFDELAGLHRALLGNGHPHPRLLAGISALVQGDVEDARAHFEADPGPYPRDYAPLGLRFHAQLAAATGDPELSGRVRAAFEPHRGQWLISLYGWDVSGPVDHWLAVLDAADRRWDDAVAGFTAARADADRLGARPWSVEASAGLASALRSRDRGTDAVDAARLADEAMREAATLGMRHLSARVDAPGQPAGEFRRDGAVWLLCFGGRSVHMPDTKGLNDLRALLSRPGTEIAAVALLAPEGGELVVAARSFGGDPVLDDEAKARYRRRLADLDDEMDRAAERDDERRVAALDRERAALLEELRAAAGLAGRTRRLGDEAERARKTVTARIRDTLRKLDGWHPELAAHLRGTVTTGATCCYRPVREVAWTL